MLANFCDVMGAMPRAFFQKLPDTAREQINSYLQRIVKGAGDPETKILGSQETLEFRQVVKGQKHPCRFLAASMSDGTLRAFGVLLALFRLEASSTTLRILAATLNWQPGRRKTKPNGSVLILLDCEDFCPAQLGPQLLHRATQVRADVPILVALAFREYETWFLAAAESLRGHAGIPNDLTTPHNPEAIRGAKEWLSARLPNG